MIPTPRTPADRAKRMLAIGLAALITATSASGQQDADSVRRLQEENASLRRRLAEMEAISRPAPSAAPAAASAAGSSVAGGCTHTHH